jgi:hypothetical protein
MTRPVAGIRQYGTHRALARQAAPGNARLTRLTLDAIIVPGSRPAAYLDHAVTLARAADCWLLVLCSQRLHGSEVNEFLAARSFTKAIIIDLPPGYSHELLDFPELRAIRKELPPEYGFYATDLSMKRNIALILAKMLGWRRVFFLDDDIRDVTYPDLQTTVDMLGSFSAVGMWVTDFPDNSIVCHANRLTRESQDVFVSGAALAVDCGADIGFFPDIYNEDWLFFLDNASNGQLANSCLKATQLAYYPFANARRAAWQEFGDVLAEGLYTLLHLGRNVQHATPEYWGYFLEARRNFLEAILTRSRNAHPGMREEMVTSVESALKCLLVIKPEVCAWYVQSWRADLKSWKWRMAGVRTMSCTEEALGKMRLVPATPTSTWRVLPHWEEARPTVTAGPVAIPQFDTARRMSERASDLDLGPVVSSTGLGDTKPFDAVDDEYLGTMATDKADDDDSLSGADEGRRRHRRSLRVRIWGGGGSPHQVSSDVSSSQSDSELVPSGGSA